MSMLIVHASMYVLFRRQLLQERAKNDEINFYNCKSKYQHHRGRCLQLPACSIPMIHSFGVYASDKLDFSLKDSQYSQIIFAESLTISSDHYLSSTRNICGKYTYYNRYLTLKIYICPVIALVSNMACFYVKLESILSNCK